VTEVHAHDQGFVSASPQRVYEVLADLGAYPRWWPGAATADGKVRVPLWGRHSEASAERHRPGTGLYLRLGSPSLGTLEWYLEPFEAGTVVSCLLDLELAGGPRKLRRSLRKARSEVRKGLVGLKRELE
jgi:uncharacterized protein YndB with AHSA1/START domain